MNRDIYKAKATVIPGRDPGSRCFNWIPAFAGMTMIVLLSATSLAQTRTMQVAPATARPVPVVTGAVSAPTEPIAAETVDAPAPVEEIKCDIVHDVNDYTANQVKNFLVNYKNPSVSCQVNGEYYLSFVNAKSITSPISMNLDGITHIKGLELESSGLGGVNVFSFSGSGTIEFVDSKIDCASKAGVAGVKIAAGSNVIIKGINLQNCMTGIVNESDNTQILGGKIEATNGVVAIDSKGANVVVDQSLAISGFATGIKLAGDASTVAGVSIAGNDSAESVGIEAIGNNAYIGSKNKISKVAKGVWIKGQGVVVTMNDLNAVPADGRIVLAEGANQGAPKLKLVASDVTKVLDHSKELINIIYFVVPFADVNVELATYRITDINEIFLSSLTQCQMIMVSEHGIKIPRGSKLVKCDNLKEKNEEKAYAWLVATNESGSASISGELKFVQMELAIIATPATGEAVRMDAGLTGDGGDVDLSGDMGAGDGSNSDPLSGGQDFVDPPANTPNDNNEDEKKEVASGNNFGSDIGLNSGGGGNIETAPLDNVGGSVGFAKSGCTLDRTSTPNSGTMILFIAMLAILSTARKAIPIRH